MDTSSTRLIAQFGNASVFKKEHATYNYQDNLRTRDVRYFAPTQVTTLPVYPVHLTNNLAKKFEYLYELTLEKFTRMNEIYFLMEGNLRPSPATTSTFVGAFLPHNRVLAPAFTLGQNFDNVRISINNVLVTNSNQINWSVLPGFFNVYDKSMRGLVHRAGLPFQKIIQEGTLCATNTTRYMATDTDFDYTSTTLSTIQTTLQKFMVPVSTFCNLFNQPSLLPPGTKISIQFIYQNCENWVSFPNTPPGVTWTQATPPDNAAVSGWVFDVSTINLQMNYYNISSTLQTQFMQEWKRQPWIVRYFKPELLPQASMEFGPTGGPPTTSTVITTRLAINDPLNTALMMFLAQPKAAFEGYDGYPQTLVGGNQFCLYAYPASSNVAKGVRLKMMPFRIDSIRIYLEDFSEPILDITAQAANADSIYQFLKTETDKFFRTNESQALVITSDIYGYRVAPFILPLHSEKYFNTQFGTIPKTASYLISYKISTIDGLQIPAGFEVYFYAVRPTTISIDSRLNTVVYDHPIEFNGTEPEDISIN